MDSRGLDLILDRSILCQEGRQQGSERQQYSLLFGAYRH